MPPDPDRLDLSFCAPRTQVASSSIVHTLLKQALGYSSTEQQLMMIQRFFYALVEQILEHDTTRLMQASSAQAEGQSESELKKLLRLAAPRNLWKAMATVLCEDSRELFIFCHFWNETDLDGFIDFTQQTLRKTSKFKLLILTKYPTFCHHLWGRLTVPKPEQNENCGDNELLSIQYDEERQSTVISSPDCYKYY